MESGAPYDATFRVRKPDGAWRWVLARGQLDRAAGTRGMMRGVVIDASLRKQTEEQLAASEERYRTLFEAIDQGVCVIEMLYDAVGRPCDYRFLEVNPAFVRATGLEHAVGRTMRSMAPDHEAHWFEVYGKVAYAFTDTFTLCPSSAMASMRSATPPVILVLPQRGQRSLKVAPAGSI